MKSPVEDLLAGYDLSTEEDAWQALREVIQHIVLLGLWRGKFFEHAAFYGGTALRMLHGLPRFSEDLDFSLLAPGGTFGLDPYLGHVQAELNAFGFDVEVRRRLKSRHSTLDSAFVKTNTRMGFLVLGVTEATTARVARERALKVKFEVDTDPPGSFDTRADYLYLPQPFTVRSFDLPSMFAGKLHAVLARSWGVRVKGRDWYDLLWFIGRNIAASLQHLRARLVQTGHVSQDDPFDAARAHTMLRRRVMSLDIDAARRDVRPFVRDARELDAWSRELFLDAVDRLRLC